MAPLVHPSRRGLLWLADDLLDVAGRGVQAPPAAGGAWGEASGVSWPQSKQPRKSSLAQDGSEFNIGTTFVGARLSEYLLQLWVGFSEL